MKAKVIYCYRKFLGILTLCNSQDGEQINNLFFTFLIKKIENTTENDGNDFINAFGMT